MKSIRIINLIRAVAFTGIACIGLSSCSSSQYGYISRTKGGNEDKQKQSEVAVKQEVVVTTPNVEIEKTEVNSEPELIQPTPSVPFILTEKKVESIPTIKALSRNNVKGLNPFAMLKTLKKEETRLKKQDRNPDSTTQSNEISGYFKTGLILILIGAIFLFFESPLGLIGSIIMLIGVIFLVLGLIEML